MQPLFLPNRNLEGRGEITTRNLSRPFSVRAAIPVLKSGSLALLSTASDSQVVFLRR
jgi:hypothetical protein